MVRAGYGGEFGSRGLLYGDALGRMSGWVIVW